MTKESYIGLRTTGRTVRAQIPSFGDMLVMADSWIFPKMAGRKRVGATATFGESNRTRYCKEQCVLYILYAGNGFVGQPDYLNVGDDLAGGINIYFVSPPALLITRFG